MEERVTTQDGYVRLQERLQAALDAYDAVCKTNAHAAGDGDTSVWHDNFAYEHNQREMHKWARRITDIRALLASVRVVHTHPNPSVAQLGSVVVFREVNGSSEWRFEIAGYEDGDVAQGRVSYTAPLMSMIVGCQVGDEREIFLDGGERTVVITAIESVSEETE